jgi:1,3-beta-glucan synthase
VVFIGTLNKELSICVDNSQGVPIGNTNGCYQLVATFDWIKRSIVSLLLVFFIAFMPLFLTELMERGAASALIRLAKHFMSLSPIFEVFSTQIYSQAILSNMTFGGARYIATGRGFATTRLSFAILYSRFAGPSIYMGMRNLLLLLYATMAIFIPHLIYFWFSVASLCIAPFLFNPHQFSFSDFVIDYREFLRWMSRGNSRTKASSWYGYCRLSRTMITGYKKKKLGLPSEKLSGDAMRASWRSVLFTEVFFPIGQAAVFVVAYLFVKSFKDEKGHQPPRPLLRILFIAVGPVVWNAVVLLTLFFVALLLGPMFERWEKFGSINAAIAHMLALLGIIVFFEFFVSHMTFGNLHKLTSLCSGSSSFGMRHMPSWVSSALSRSSARSRRSSFRCSLRVSTSTTRRIVHGGRVGGMVVASAVPRSPSQPVNSWSRS